MTNSGVLLGDGTGKLQIASRFSISGELNSYLTGTGKPVIADFNSDGKLDVAQGGYAYSSDTSIYAVLGDGSGDVSQSTVVGQTGANPVGGDFNKDGKPDLVLLKSRSVSLLVNNTTETNALVFSKKGNSRNNSDVVDASSQSDSSLSVNLAQKKLQVSTLLKTVVGVFLISNIENLS